MKARILRVLEYEGELEDLVKDSQNWGLRGTRTFGMPGHKVTIREMSSIIHPAVCPELNIAKFAEEKIDGPQ